MAKKRGESGGGGEINEGDSNEAEAEEQNPERLPWLSGERGIFDPDGIFTVHDLAHRTGMTLRKAKEFLRDHVPAYPHTKSLRVFRGSDYVDAITRLVGPDPADA